MEDFKSRFYLSSDDCELLLEFERCHSLQELASAMNRDHSVIARSLKRLSESFPVVEKKGGKWVLSEIGRKINESSRSAIAAQVSALNQYSTLTIGTNREFAARVIAAEFRHIQNLLPKMQISVQTFENGTEKALLDGKIDIGLDCDRPFDPEVSYKLVIDEPIISVASKSFIKTHKKEVSSGQYFHLPHLLCERLHPDKILSRSENHLVVAARFNDIATTRAVCLEGCGWALLPTYSVKHELASGELVQIDQKAFGRSKYGVWWLRSRPHLKSLSETMISWLQTQKL